MSARPSRGARRALAVSVALGCLALPALPSQAAPVASLRAPTSAQLGLPTQIELSGPRASAGLSLPATPGLRPERLLLDVEWPLTGTYRLEARTSGGRLASLASPAERDRPSRWSIVLPASSRPTELTFLSESTTRDQSCGPVESRTVRLLPRGVTGSVVPVPATVGGYLAGPLPGLEIGVPAQLTPEVAQAALRLSTGVVARTPSRSLRVSVVPATTQTTLSARRVTLDPSAPAGARVTPEGLVLGGAGEALVRQADLVTGALAPVLQTGEAELATLSGVERRRAGASTLADLGASALTASGVGTFRIPVAFDQSATGGELSGVRLSLSGTNAAVPADASASATLTIAGEAVASTDLGTSGRWSLDAELAPTQVRRTIGAEVVVTYTDSGGACTGDPEPLLVSVSPSSRVDVVRGTTLGAPGFLQLPQALLPRATVVLDDLTASSLAQAVDLTSGLQSLSRVPLLLDVAVGSALPGGDQPLVVVTAAGRPLASQLRPAGVDAGTTLLTSPGSEAARVRIEPGQALLSAGRLDSGRLVVSLIDTADAQGATALLDALGSRTGAWAELVGDVAALAPDGRISTAQLVPAPTASLSDGGRALLEQDWVLVLLGAALMAVLLLLSWAVRARTGRGPRRGAHDGSTPPGPAS